MKNKRLTIKAWAVMDDNWKEKKWKDCLYQQMAAIRGGSIFTYAVFERKQEATAFRNLAKSRKGSRVVPVEIIINPLLRERIIHNL